jgi:hypothetical protein
MFSQLQYIGFFAAVLLPSDFAWVLAAKVSVILQSNPPYLKHLFTWSD